VEEKGRK
jgi:hypothetical protein